MSGNNEQAPPTKKHAIHADKLVVLSMDYCRPNTHADSMIDILQTVLVIVNIRLAFMSMIPGLNKNTVKNSC